MTDSNGARPQADQAGQASPGANRLSPPFGDHPSRVQLRRTKGWRMPDNTVKVDRSTKWGNPWTVPGDYEDPREAVERFRRAVIGPVLDGKQREPDARPGSYIRAIIDFAPTELRGKNLACWCPIINSHGDYSPCHADVLLSLANDVPMEEVIRENTRRAKGETL